MRKSKKRQRRPQQRKRGHKVVGDPDAGQQIRADVRRQILLQRSAVAKGERGRALADVVKEGTPSTFARIMNDEKRRRRFGRKYRSFLASEFAHAEQEQVRPRQRVESQATEAATCAPRTSAKRGARKPKL